MPVEFREETRRSPLLDPFGRFQEKERTVQIREDPLTGAVSRVFSYRRRPPQQTDAAVENRPPVCAFCPENVESMTPEFPPRLYPRGRIRRGEAVVFPNLFPYDTHNAVVVITDRHEVTIDEWSHEKLADALEASKDYMRRVVGAEGGDWFYSINWNYTPIAGASQVHPHLQVIASRKPTLEQGRLLQASADYFADNSSNYWEDLIRAEREKGERYLGRTGEICWLVNFAPPGFIPDVTAVFPGDTDFTRCGEGGTEDFSRGLVRLFKYYGNRRVTGANLTLYSRSPGRKHFWTHAKIVPRLRIPPLNISDVNYFKLMHDEAISLLTPEEVCREMKPFFNRRS